MARWNQTILVGAIFLITFLPRALNLDVFLTADEAISWTGRSIFFLEALLRGDFAATFDSPAPGITTVWMGVAGLVANHLAHGGTLEGLGHFLETLPFDPIRSDLLPWLRLPTALVTALAVSGIYLLARRLFDGETALLGAGLLALDPFYLALSRILGHDSLVATFMTLSTLSLLACLHGASTPSGQEGEKRGSLRLMVLAGGVGGLAFLSKYPALFLVPFTVLLTLVAYGWHAHSHRDSLKRAILALALWGVAAGLIFFLLWPAMWADPLYPPARIIGDALRASAGSHQKGSFFFGQPVDDPGPWFYPVNGLFRATPIGLIGMVLAIVAISVAVWRRWCCRGSSQGDSASGSGVLWAGLLLLYALLFGALITLGGKKQDRYLLPSLLPLTLFAAFGWMAGLRWLLGRVQEGRWQGLAPAGVAVLLAGQALVSLPYHPYYFTYYNPLLGGGRTAPSTVLVGWGEGIDQAARYLNGLPGAADLRVVSWYSSTFEPFFVGHTLYEVEEEKLSRSSKPPLAADYVVFYINQLQRQFPSPGAIRYFQQKPPVYTVQLSGIDYAWVYPAPGVRHIIGSEARLVGQAELLGYDLEGVKGDPPGVHADEGFTLHLYWEWQGKRPEDLIYVSLVDDAGETRGWGNPLPDPPGIPFERWPEGMIARSDYFVAVFEDTPPGLYHLKSWIYSLERDEVIGVFPTDPAEMTIAVTEGSD
jgi:4-amino-4-deoxy-L-arabinose transferase-like glycosyltransferase